MVEKKIYTNSILGVRIAVTNMEEAVSYILGHLEELRGEYICLSNVHTTMMAWHDPEYRKAQNDAAICLPDGAPLSYILRRRHFSEAERVAGPDLMPALWRASEQMEEREVRHFFYGSTEETIAALEANLKKNYPKLSLAGFISPPFRELTEEEDREMEERINAVAPDILWVGLGAPKQELWMQRHRGRIHAVMLGVGAGFDFHAGTLKRAPLFFQTHYLEWLYRLFQDPLRLGKRYITTNFQFLALALTEKDEGSVRGIGEPVKKRLLIYAHYYAPDVAATGQILTELAEGLLDDFDCTVICTVPSYTGRIAMEYRRHKYFHENIGGVKVLRIRVPEFRKSFMLSRLYNIVSYFVSAAWATRQIGSQDIVFSISQPPILGGLLGRFGKKQKKAKFVYNIQDFNPEQSRAVGVGNPRLTYRLLRKIDTDTCRMADEVIVVGRDMVETLKDRFPEGDLPRYACIPNWAREDELVPLEKEHGEVRAFRSRYGLEDSFVIMYSGNLGLYYDLENLLPAVAEITEQLPQTMFCLVGEGSVEESLKRRAEKEGWKSIRFIPYQPKEKLLYSLNAADVHLVVSARGIRGVSVPSKLYGVMAVAKPVLGVLEEGSEAAETMKEAGCGLLSNPGDMEGLKRNLKQLLQMREDPEGLAAMGKAGRDYLTAHLKMETAIRRYREELLAVCAE